MRALMAVLFVGGLAMAGCSDDDGKKNNDASVNDMNTDGNNVGDGGGGDGSTGTLDFEDYVIDLIKNKTNDTGTPDDYTTKTFTDSQDPAKFSTLF